MSKIHQKLDASGLNCPLPILRAKKALNAMESGQYLQVIATDPGAVDDFEAFSRQTGHVLKESTRKDAHFHFLICKS